MTLAVICIRGYFEHLIGDGLYVKDDDVIEVESSESKSSSGRSVNDHLLLWSGETSWPTTMAHHPHVRQTVLIMLDSACIHTCLRCTVLICLLDRARMRSLIIASGRY